LNLSSFHFVLISWLILSYLVFQGIKIIAPAEIFTNSLFFFIAFIIFFFSLPKFNFSNLPVLNFPDIFLPFGIILFSLVGWSAIPEIGEILKNSDEKKFFKKVIILSTAISAVFYILFGILVAGVSGRNTSADALSGLIPFLGSKIVFFGVLAGLITIADSFLILALYLRNTLVRDLKFPKIPAFLIACGSPLILFLLGFRNFINTIGFVGTIIGAVEGIIIILIFKNAKKLGDREPEYSLKIPSMLLYFLMAIFILGAVFQFFK